MSKALVTALGDRFLERRDVKAWQFPGGGYTPERTPITWGDLKAHLAGEKSMGHYLVSESGDCRLFAFDIDLRGGAVVEDELGFSPRSEFANPKSAYRRHLTAQLARCAEWLAQRSHDRFDTPVAIAFSGNKGLHVYDFTGTAPAEAIRIGARCVLTDLGFEATRGDNFWTSGFFPELEVEMFPKQDKVNSGGLGNLMRLPLGINKKSGKPSRFLSVNDGTTARMGPLDALYGKLPW